MVTKHPRINVTFGEDVACLLADLASHGRQSVASLVRELTIESLEIREDFYLT